MVALLLGLLVGALNVDFRLTLLAVILAVSSLYSLIFSTRGLATGFLETLNGDLKSSIYAFTTLFSAAECSIDIVTGHFCPMFYFNREVLTSLRDAIARGVRVRIILADSNASLTRIQKQIDSEIRDEFGKWLSEGKIWIGRFTGRIPFHFLIIDDKHVRIEESHPERADLEKPYCAKAGSSCKGGLNQPFDTRIEAEQVPGPGILLPFFIVKAPPGGGDKEFIQLRPTKGK